MSGRASRVGVALGIVVALLAADVLFLHVFMPRLWSTIPDERVRNVDRDIWGIKEALGLFQRDCGFFPADLDSLVVDKAKNVKCNGSYNPVGYLDIVPMDPWGRPYIYLSDGHRYLIASYGADGKRGGRGKDEDAEIRNF